MMIDSESTLCLESKLVHWTKLTRLPKSAFGGYSFNPHRGIYAVQRQLLLRFIALVFNGMSSVSGLKKFADKPIWAVAFVGL